MSNRIDTLEATLAVPEGTTLVLGLARGGTATIVAAPPI